jgi:osmotically inducible protein OsmC
MDVLYTAQATSVGSGRNGEVRSSDGVIDEKLAMPEEMGGPGGAYTNPEQLFAAGYSACFHNALLRVAKESGVDLPQDTSVTADVGLGKSGDAFQLTVALQAYLPGVEPGRSDEMVAQAHQICPYSNATRGNIEVVVTATG